MPKQIEKKRGNCFSPNQRPPHKESTGSSNKKPQKSSNKNPRGPPSPNSITRKNQKSRTINMGKLVLPIGSTLQSTFKLCQNEEYRDYMEDVVLVLNNYLNDPFKHIYAVFDGHGGDESARLSSVLFPEIFARYLKDYSSNIEYCLKKTFAKIDLETKKHKCVTIGNTATVVYIQNKLFFCANVGDSACVLVSKNGAKQISYDDKCTDPAEIKRVEAEGGFILDERLDGQLAITRALGDHDLKGRGLSCEPHIYKTMITDNEMYCVIASDGIWDDLTPNDIYEICKSSKNVDSIVDRIITTALERGSEDNISCIVVAFQQS